MSCLCEKLPRMLKVEDYPDFERRLKQLDMANWTRLFRCNICEQLWAIDEWEKYQWQFAFKVESSEGWQKVDFTDLRKQHLIQSRGGLTNEKCIWAGCEGHRVKGVAYCADHLYKTGARE